MRYKQVQKLTLRYAITSAQLLAAERISSYLLTARKETSATHRDREIHGYSFCARTWLQECPAYVPHPTPSSFASAGPLLAATRARAKGTAVQHTRSWASARSRADRPVTICHHEPAYTAGEFCPLARERKHAPLTQSSHLLFCTHLSFCVSAFMPYRQSHNLPAKGL